MAASTSSGFHTYSSWGRTRRPKNLNGASSTAVVTLHSTDSSAPTTVAHGYATENQRYLHLHASGSSSGCDNIYTYLYASQQWSELVEPSGSVQRASVACDANQTRIIEIAGADLIAFNTGSNSDGIYAAFSTF